MAWAYVDLVLKALAPISGEARWILVLLAEHAPKPPKDPIAYPSVDRLARISGIGARRVVECLAEIRDGGWATKLPGTGHGPGNPAQYLLHIEKLKRAREEAIKGADVTANNPANVRAKKEANVRRKWTPEKAKEIGAIGAHVVDEMRRTGAEEPGFNRTSEPTRAPAREPNASEIPTEPEDQDVNPWASRIAALKQR